MKIKKFERFLESWKKVESDVYYIKLTAAECENLFPEDDFTISELDYIKNFIPNIYKCEQGWIPEYKRGLFYSNRLIFSNDVANAGNHIASLTKPTNIFIITKLKDEWYALNIIRIKGINHDDLIYKCDRLDGLEKCFKEKCV